MLQIGPGAVCVCAKLAGGDNYGNDGKGLGSATVYTMYTVSGVKSNKETTTRGRDFAVYGRIDTVCAGFSLTRVWGLGFGVGVWGWGTGFRDYM